MKISSYRPQGTTGLSPAWDSARLSPAWDSARLSPARDRARPSDVGRRAVLAGGLALGLGAMAGCSSSSSSAAGKTLPTVPVLAFQAPSLGAFITAVITHKGFDTAHGLHLAFSYVTPDNYTVEFSSGQFQVGGSSALLSEALRVERGVPVTYLFNSFDFFGAVVTSDPAIHTLTDLRGHSLAAALGTTNYAMFQWFALKAGLNLKQVLPGQRDDPRPVHDGPDRPHRRHRDLGAGLLPGPEQEGRHPDPGHGPEPLAADLRDQ
jgi:hypothetical protein